MGVPGLESYAEQNGGEGQGQGRRGSGGGSRPFFYRVSISDLVSQWRQSNNQDASSRQAVIVVDLMGCLRKLYLEQGCLELLCGGQHREYLEVWRDVLRRFRECGAELAFVYDGATRAGKRPEWSRRREETWGGFGAPVFGALRRGEYPRVDPRGSVSLPSLMTQQLLRDVLGCEVLLPPTGLEADELVCRVARERNAVAILGQDSDFVVYDCGDVPYLSVKHLDLDAMSTRRYDRGGLARHLGLSADQLPLLALLRGNDLVPRDRLKPFHDWLMRGDRRRGHYGHRLLERVAEYILSTGMPRSRRQILACLEKVARDVFRGCTEEDERIARKVVEGYFLLTRAEEKKKTAAKSGYESAVDSLLGQSAQLHSIATTRTFESSFVLFDFGDDSSALPSPPKLMAPMRRRIYGVLLRESPLDPPLTVTEWCFDGPGSLEEPVARAAEYPPEEMGASLERLRNREDKSPETEELRWRVFAHVVSPRMELASLRRFPSELTYVAAQLFYMQHEAEAGPVLFPWEVRVFVLARLALPSKSVAELSAIPIPPTAPDHRGVQLATLFLRTPLQTAAKMVLLPTAGREDLLLVRNYDGKLFQWLYLEAKREDKTLTEMAEREGVDAELMERLVSFATSGGKSVRKE